MIFLVFPWNCTGDHQSTAIHFPLFFPLATDSTQTLKRFWRQKTPNVWKLWGDFWTWNPSGMIHDILVGMNIKNIWNHQPDTKIDFHQFWVIQLGWSSNYLEVPAVATLMFINLKPPKNQQTQLPWKKGYVVRIPMFSMICLFRSWWWFHFQHPYLANG